MVNRGYGEVFTNVTLTLVATPKTGRGKKKPFPDDHLYQIECTACRARSLLMSDLKKHKKKHKPTITVEPKPRKKR